MLNKRRILTALLYILLLGGACTRQVDESALHTIDLEEAIDNIEEVMLSEYVSSLKYTPIETHPSALLGKIDHWFAANDSIMFFVYPDTQTCIYLFTRDGKYVKSIGAKGNGPGEYIAVRSMSIIPQKNALFVEGGPEIVIYSLEDRKCIAEKWINDFFDNSNDIIKRFNGRESMSYNIIAGNMIYHNDNIYATTANNTTLEQYFLKMNPNYSLDTIVFMRPTTLSVGMPMVVRCYLYLYDNKVNVIHGCQDTIYTWENESLVPHMLINFGDIPSITTMPQIKETSSFFSKTRHMRGQFAQIVTASAKHIFTETDNFFIGSVFLPEDIVESNNLKLTSEFVYDKKTRKTKIIKHSGELETAAFTNDIDGGMPFWPTKRIDNKLYQFVDAGKFIEMSEKYNSPEMKRIASTLTEESNPVIIEATLK